MLIIFAAVIKTPVYQSHLRHQINLKIMLILRPKIVRLMGDKMFSISLNIFFNNYIPNIYFIQQCQ
jgi:hypothetical protein